MSQPWYDAPVTNPHPPDDGIDLGTPDRTPVYFPYPGTVLDAEWFDYGGQVAVDTGQGFIEYFIHLNQISVQPGEHVDPGQVIGDTGGGIGDLVLHDGVVQPAQDQSWYDGHSTGYHTEYGEFLGSTLGEFNEGWHNAPRQLDPTPVIEALKQGQAVPQGGKVSGVSADAAGSGGTNWSKVPIVGGLLQETEWEASMLTPQGWAQAIGGGLSTGVAWITQGILNALGFSNLGNFALRSATFSLGIAFIIGGVLVIVIPMVRPAMEKRDDALAALAPLLAKVGK